MKNQRATVVLVSVSLACAVGLVAAISWYRSGAIPSGPESFFFPHDVEGAMERLEAFRIDMTPAIRMCRDIMNHAQSARDVSFTNFDEAARTVRGLSLSLAALQQEYDPLIDELDSGAPDQWAPPFREFVEQSSAAYSDALGLCRLLLEEDWAQADIHTLQASVMEAKDLAAHLRDSPVWNQSEPIRRQVYPGLEEAYRRRNETDPDRFMPLLLQPSPPVVLWMYARLFEVHSPLPADLCAAALRRHAEALSAFQADLAAADARGVLSRWTFLADRPGRALDLAALLDPLEASDAYPEWVSALGARESERKALIADTQAASDHPDAQIKLSMAELEGLARKTDVTVRALRTTRTIDAVSAFVESVRQQAESHPRFAECGMKALLAAAEAGSEVNEAVADVLRRDAGGEPEALAGRFADIKRSAETLGAIVGADFADDVTRDAVNTWCSERWPPVDEAKGVAALFHRLQRDGTLTDKALADAAAVLENVPAVEGPVAPAGLAQQWHRALTPDMESGYPALVRRMRGDLRDLERRAAEDEVREWIGTGQIGRLRSAAERVLAEPARAGWESPRRDARSILMILDLPEKIDALDVSSLGELHVRNAEKIPPAPETSSPIWNLYAERVEPLLAYAAAIDNVADPRPDQPMQDDECATTILGAWTHREKLSRVYARWDSLDQAFVAALTAASRPCLPVRSDTLFALADVLDEVAAWDGLTASDANRISLQAEAAVTLAQVLRMEPSTDGYAIQLHQAELAVEAVGGMRPDLAEWFAWQAAIGVFAEQVEDLPNSYRRLQREMVEFAGRIAEAPGAATPREDAIVDLLAAYERGFEALAPLVERDFEMAGDAGTTLDNVIVLAGKYAEAAVNPAMPARLARYARDQSSCLRSYAGHVAYTFRPAFTASAATREIEIPYRILGTNIAALGYGPLREGKGDNLQVWVRTAGAPQVLMTADWRDDPKHKRILLTDIAPDAATVSWTWGTPLQFGIRVAHTLDPNRDVVPDRGRGRSRWNPFDYGHYRVETNEYPIATFASPEAMIRRHPDPANTNLLPRCRMDTILNPDLDLGPAPALLCHVDGMDPGRDFDWPDRIDPMDEDDARRLRLDAGQAISNLVDQVFSIGGD